MSGKGQYVGNVYSFEKKELLGKGGNGAVYNVQIEGLKFPVVAKFFEYSGKDKEIRYKRFVREIEFVRDMQGALEGILPILDYQYTEDIPDNKDEAWFLMPRAEQYTVRYGKNLLEKINFMIQLAQIIKVIHQREYAHRDIKPENILIYKNKLVLSDFGLIWGMEEERLTHKLEKIGPYKILPPELEHVVDLDIDYRPSDVYLFAKVLWMNIKEDNLGFRSQYDRGAEQIYLRRQDYNIQTLEPLHKLIEGATYHDMHKRLTIEKCINLLQLQKDIIEEHQIEEVNYQQLLFEEYTAEKFSKYEPSEVIYTDKSVICDILRDIIPISKTYIQSSVFSLNNRQIQVSKFQVLPDQNCCMVYYYNGKRVKEYLFGIKKLGYFKQDKKYIIELEQIRVKDSRYVPIYETINRIGNMYPKIYLTTDEKIIIMGPGNVDIK